MRRGTKESYTQAGYRQIREVTKRDHWFAVWRGISQVMLLLLILLGGYIAYGYYRGLPVWEYAVGYWMIMTIRNVAEFMARRLRL